MRSLSHRLLGDPILQFTAIGAILFALHALVAAPEATSLDGETAPSLVVISAERVAGLTEGWTEAWGRAPTAAEVGELVEEEVRTEILAREAVAQGLDRDDEYIRQHLRERLEVMIDAGGGSAEPTEAELEAFYAANRSRFGAGPVVSFQQLVLDPARRGDRLGSDAAALLERLRAGGVPGDVSELGDGLELPGLFEQVPEDDLAAMFGGEFAQALLAAAPGQWIGPVGSSYGQHLLRLDARAEASGLPFAEVRENVREEWLAARVAARRDRYYRDLRARFTVDVEQPGQPHLAAAAAP